MDVLLLRQRSINILRVGSQEKVLVSPVRLRIALVGAAACCATPSFDASALGVRCGCLILIAPSEILDRAMSYSRPDLRADLFVCISYCLSSKHHRKPEF